MDVAVRTLNNVAISSQKDQASSLHPKVLIATTSRWYPTVRLTMALAGYGCEVGMLCPSGHPITKTRAAKQIHLYNGLVPLHSFAAAIAGLQPDLVIPADDLAVRQLHRLYELESKKGRAESLICRLIERSLGAAESFPVAYARSAFMKMAEEEGIRIPKTQVIENLIDLKDWNIRNGFPAVLKADGTSGGYGVRIANTMEEAERAFRFLQAPPRLLRAAKRALLDRDTTLIWPALCRRRFVVNAQAFVDGKEATTAVACWNGKVLAAIHFGVINKRSSSGPATVVRRIENAEMSAAAEKMSRRLNLSGVHGFDFMLEEQTGNAYLIELNPRATQVCHLALGPKRDIPAALYAVLSGKDAQPAPIVTEKEIIALFPQEWTRDSQSEFLRSAHHDVPWEEPELIRDCVNSRRKQSSWYSLSGKEQSSSPIRSSKPVAAPAENQAAGLD